MGGRLYVLELAARGPSGQDLSIDIGWFGSDSPLRALVHSSGIHGVEGFGGSAIQLQLLDHMPQLPDSTAVVLVHVLNPFGMSWIRRVNENNVDLNRNFLAEDHYRGAPQLYGALDPFLNPDSPPDNRTILFKAGRLLVRFGPARLLQAVGGGQYEFPRGLFFGGKKREEGLEKYQGFIEERLGVTERVLGVDVHTGLGRFSKDLLIVEPQHYAELRREFGSRVISSQPKYLPVYRIRGGHHELLTAAVPGARVRFITQEFGTYNPLKVLRALREENRWHHHGEGHPAHQTKRALKEVFCPVSKRWREAVLERGQRVFEMGLHSLVNVEDD